MAFQTQNARENRKILLEDLQIKKLQLLKQGVVPLTSTPLSIPSVPGNVDEDVQQYILSHGAKRVKGDKWNIVDFNFITVKTPSPGSEHLSSIQRGAVIQAQASFGFFVPQDSLFGNVILPVLPRYENKP